MAYFFLVSFFFILHFTNSCFTKQGQTEAKGYKLVGSIPQGTQERQQFTPEVLKLCTQGPL